MKSIFMAVLVSLYSCLFAYNPNVTVNPGELHVVDTYRINPGTYQTFKYYLNSGTQFNAIFNVSGGLDDSIHIWLLDVPNFNLFHNHKQYRYFKGTSGNISGNASYKFIIPYSGYYYVVLDNTSSFLLARNVYITLFSIPQQKTQVNVNLENGLQGLYNNIKDEFIFDDIHIDVSFLGDANAFSDFNTGNITISFEILNASAKQGLSGNILFVFFHELGHSLFNLWGLPLGDNEDLADEFATVILLQHDLDKMAIDAASYWNKQTSRQEALSKIYLDDRHTISPQRARNIIKWINNKPALLRRWQTILMPHMTTQYLRSQLNSDLPWTNPTAIRNELATRD